MDIVVYGKDGGRFWKDKQRLKEPSLLLLIIVHARLTQLYVLTVCRSYLCQSILTWYFLRALCLIQFPTLFSSTLLYPVSYILYCLL